MNPTLDDFHLLAISPCINTGDPNSPLDPDGTRADMGALYFDCSGGGLLIPNAPTDFTIAHNNAELIATLSWVNPSVNALNEPLTELNGVKVYRDAEMIADLTDVTIGAPYTYDDETVPLPNLYDYEIVPYNSYGNGISAEGSAWIGLDTPGQANDVLATPDPNEELICTITWSAPTEGGHGGYWPMGSWAGQKIYRDGAVIANLPGTNTSYVDNNIPISNFYSYGVSYYNSSGEGPITPADPDPVFVGPPQFQQIPYDWIEISGIGTNTGINGDDQVLGPFDIGFSFPFYDYSAPTQVWVCSNGWSAFEAVSYGAYNNVEIPNTGLPNNMVCPFWDDLNPSLGGAVYYYQDAANERFIVEWSNVPHYSTGGTYTFEMILFPNGDIELMYHTLTPGTANSATVGIENAGGTDGIQVTFDGSGPLEPVPQMGIRIYSVALGVPSVSVTLTPYGTPIRIPASGGSFDYNIAVQNLEAFSMPGQIWCDVTLPNGSTYGPVLGPVTVNMPGGFSGDRDRTQEVPGVAPSGFYTYNGYVGSYPGVVWAQDSFQFEKLTTGSGPWIEGWDNYGESFDEWMAAGKEAGIPEVFALDQNYPNPFNPVTTIGFALPTAQRVVLTVYDISGRAVATLVNGWRDAGYHEVTFNADALASGMYVYRIQAGDFTASGKMVMMK